MEPIPDCRKDVTKNVPNERRNENDRNGSGEVKLTDHNRHTDHMRPLTKADERLRPSERDENRPHEVYGAEELTEGKSGLGRIEMIHVNNVIRLILLLYQIRILAVAGDAKIFCFTL